MPGGWTQLRISASLSHADTLLPRFMLTAVWIGLTISMSTNTTTGQGKRAADRPSLLDRADCNADGDREDRRASPR